MRDLYAVQLPFDEPATKLDSAILLAAEWCSRSLSSTVDAAALLIPGTFSNDEGRGAEIAANPGQLWSAVVTAPADADPTLSWRTQVTLSVVDDRLMGTFRIGLGATPGALTRVSPLSYEFSSPTIVRTLLRELVSVDAGWTVSTRADAIGAADVDDLVEFLLNPKRRLPVLLVTNDPATGQPVFPGSDDQMARPEHELARELAGLAHVRTLSSGYASRQLTERLGRQLSVWHGAVRIYWPGLTMSDDPYAHRLWSQDRLRGLRRPLVSELRHWLATLSVARTPEHPGLLAARRDQSKDIHEWAEFLEGANEQLTGEMRGIQADLDARDAEILRLQAKLDALSFGTAASSEQPEQLAEPTTVLEALNRIEEEFGDGIVFLDSARKSASDFSSYNDPGKAYRALRAVAEASDAKTKGGLGKSLPDFFRERGFEYQGSNDIVKDRRYKTSYTITYEGQRRVMEPHLKVDEATSPDQCMRIYWWDDPAANVFVVGQVGRHLPPL